MPCLDLLPAVTLARLQGGTALQGRLETQMGGAWSAICSTGFGGEEARVACRQLGLAGGSVSGVFPKGRLPFAAGSVVCRGNEANLAACKYSLTSACPGGRPVGLVCQSECNLSPCQPLLLLASTFSLEQSWPARLCMQNMAQPLLAWLVLMVPLHHHAA
jgi:hypothetical protein